MSALPVTCLCGMETTMLQHRPFNPKTGRFQTVAWCVECVPCGIRAGWRNTEEAAIAAWNRRAGDDEVEKLLAEVEKLRSAAAYQSEAHTLRTGIKLHTERLRAMGYTNRKQESNLQMIGRAMDEIATLRAELAAAREALKDARLQLEYLDSRWPTGTTPTILTRINVALGNQK